MMKRYLLALAFMAVATVAHAQQEIDASKIYMGSATIDDSGTRIVLNGGLDLGADLLAVGWLQVQDNAPFWQLKDLDGAADTKYVRVLFDGGAWSFQKVNDAYDSATNLFVVSHATGAFTTGIWQGTVVGLTYGGTAKNLTASAGGVVWTDADSMEVLAGTATAGQMLRSGASATPAWSTATWPTTASTTGAYLRADGTNWITSTLVLPNSATAGDTVVATAANTWGAVAAGAAGKLYQAAGAGTVPAWTTATYPSVGTATASYLRADGTNWIASTLKLPNAATSGRVVFASAADTYGEDADLTFATDTLTATKIVGTTNATTPTLYGSAADNGDITIEGTSSATKTTSYVIVQPTGGNVGMGTTTPGAKVHALATTEQLRLGYDAANYASFTTGSGGGLTIAPSGGDTSVTGTLAATNRIYSQGGFTYNPSGNKWSLIPYKTLIGSGSDETPVWYTVAGLGAHIAVNGSPLSPVMTITAGGNVGFNTTAADKAVEINSATGATLRQTYNDANGSATTYTDQSVSSAGVFTFDAAGSDPSFLFSDSVSIATGKTLATSYGSGWAGTGYTLNYNASYASQSFLEVDRLSVRGIMSVYELLVHQIRATNGSIFVANTGKAKAVTDNGASSYTIETDGAHGFAVNDLVRAQRFTTTGGGGAVYQSDLTVTAVADTTHFTATLRATYTVPAVGMDFVRLGNTTDADRQGSIYLTADDTNAPYINVLSGVAAFTDWGTTAKTRVRMGNLNGWSDYATNLYGLGIGDSANTHIDVDATNGVRFRNSTTTLGQLTSSAWTLGSTGSEHVAISSTAVQIKDGATVYADLTAGALSLGSTAAEHVLVNTSGVALKDAAVVYGVFAATTTLGVTTEEHLSLTSSGIEFKNSATVNGSLAADVWTLGQTANEHILLNTSGLAVKDGANVYAQFAATTTVGLTASEHVSISSTAVQIKDGATVLTDVSGGNVLVGQTGASQSNVYITSGAVQMRTNTTVNAQLTAAGLLVLGQDANNVERVEIDGTSLRMISDVAGVETTVLTLADGAGSFTGSVTAAGGVVLLDSSGATVAMPATDTGFTAVNAYRFRTNAGVNGAEFGLYAKQTSVPAYRYLGLLNTSTSDVIVQTLISATNTSKTAVISVVANSVATGGLGHIVLNPGSGGDTQVEGTLGVSGTLNGAAANFSGDFKIATTKFTVASATGNTVIAGTTTHGGNILTNSAGSNTIGASGTPFGELWVNQIVVGAPTGGAKGAGTINAVAVYDDNVLLTDWVFDMAFGDSPAATPAHALYSLDTTRLVSTTQRRLPWMPSKAEFETARHVGGMVTRLWQGQEQQQLYIFDLEARIAQLEAGLAALRDKQWEEQ